MSLIIDNPNPTVGQLREAKAAQQKAFKARAAELAKRGDNAAAVVKTLKDNKAKYSLELIVRTENGKTKKVFTSEPFAEAGLVEGAQMKGVFDGMILAALNDPFLANPVQKLKAAQAEVSNVRRTLQKEGEAHYEKMRRFDGEIDDAERREREVSVRAIVNAGRDPRKPEPYREKTFAERVGRLVASTPTVS